MLVNSSEDKTPYIDSTYCEKSIIGEKFNTSEG
jgi:hypothetical protein